MKVQIFDPPMCCSTGICGPGVDRSLVEFTADLDWLKRQGVEVERYNLSQQTDAFVNNMTVREALKKDGNDCLPLVLVDGKIVLQGSYPKRDILAKMAGIEAPKQAFKLTIEQPATADSACCTAPSVTAGSCCDETSEKSDKKSSCC